MLLTVPRQLGKSWLLRELAFWRMHQGERFGEPQDVLHTGKDLEICVEVQRPARVWAKQRPEYRVREANGRVEIELPRGRVPLDAAREGVRVRVLGVAGDGR